MTFLSQDSGFCLPQILFHSASEKLHELFHVSLNKAQLLRKWLSVFVSDCTDCEIQQHKKEDTT